MCRYSNITYITIQYIPATQINFATCTLFTGLGTNQAYNIQEKHSIKNRSGPFEHLLQVPLYLLHHFSTYSQLTASLFSKCISLQLSKPELQYKVSQYQIQTFI